MLALRKTPSWLILGAALLAVSQCSSGPALRRQLTVEAGKKIVVAYVQARGPALTMINTSGLSKTEAKAALAEDPSLKVVPDDQLQRVLDVFGGNGYFAFATTAGSTRFSHILVATDQARHALPSGNEGPRAAEATTAFGHCLSVFFAVYNATDSYSERKAADPPIKASAERLDRRGEHKKP